MELEDQFILKKIQNPETKNYGFNLLVNQYQKRVYWLIRKMVIDHDDANDLTQEIFIRIYKRIESFRGDSKLFTWIYKIATNECLTFLKNKKKRFFLPLIDVEKELSLIIDSGIGLAGTEIEIKLQKAILTLPDKQRLVFQLKYFEDMSYEEMAEITQTSVGALKASYHHAVKKIEDSLASD